MQFNAVIHEYSIRSVVKKKNKPTTLKYILWLFYVAWELFAANLSSHLQSKKRIVTKSV